MTHSLHRRGTTEDLLVDYVVLAMAAKGINEEGAAKRLREFLRIAAQLSPVNVGDMRTGNGLAMELEEIGQRLTSTSIVHVVFTEVDTVGEFLRCLQDADLGLSVVVSGLFDPLRRCCSDAGFEPAFHTVEHSLGVWGRAELLPGAELLEISTMCGHGMVSSRLIEEAVADIKAGSATTKEAAERLARPCVCGIFNPQRAELLLNRMTKKAGSHAGSPR